MMAWSACSTQTPSPTLPNKRYTSIKHKPSKKCEQTEGCFLNRSPPPFGLTQRERSTEGRPPSHSTLPDSWRVQLRLLLGTVGLPAGLTINVSMLAAFWSSASGQESGRVPSAVVLVLKCCSGTVVYMIGLLVGGTTRPQGVVDYADGSTEFELAMGR